MTTKTCPDCAVQPGEMHVLGCDVARCTGCGAQHLGHDLGCGQPTTWTGECPGDAEVREGLASDLNDLAVKGATGQLRWDGQRWQRPAPVAAACALCGGQLQATSKIYWTLDPERGWVPIDFDNEAMTIYCEDDHEMSPTDDRLADLDRALGEAVVQLGRKAADDVGAYLTRAGVTPTR